MGSTFLARLKVGQAGGCQGGKQALQERLPKHIVGLVLAAMIPVVIPGAMSPPL